MAIDITSVLVLAKEVINRQQAVINLIVPTAQDFAKALIEERKPTPEQVAAWDKVNSEVTRKMKELTGAILQLEQALGPLKFDA